MNTITPRFVEFVPESLEQGVLYVSMQYSTASHLCACGCGAVVVTPLKPTGWTLSFDGKVSLDPSIGNWSMNCKSHYWIKKNQIQWSRKWGKDEIADVRAWEASDRADHFRKRQPTEAAAKPDVPEKKRTLWEEVIRLITGRGK